MSDSACRLRILVVDDSRIFLGLMERFISRDHRFEVIGSVWNEAKAIEFIGHQRPDLVTLDVEMPEMDGIETLRRNQPINQDLPESDRIGILMVSSLTLTGAKVTIEALELGAFDFIPKQQDLDSQRNQEMLQTDLLARLRAYALKRLGAPLPAPTAAEVENLRAFIGRSCGLPIPPEKHYLIGQRLEDLARTAGRGSYGGLLLSLGADASGQLRDQVIEAITTNETSFFREQHPFEALRMRVFPFLLDRLSHARVGPGHPRPGPIRLWCCGASTGQEPYSLAMTIHQFVRANKFRGISLEDYRILATDISQLALNKGKAGRYTDAELNRGITPELCAQFFRWTGGAWEVNPDVAGLMTWMKVNLLDAFTLLGSFQVITCRNVLIYFDESLKARIIERFHRMLEDGGFLLLGSTEIIPDPGTRFTSTRVGNTILYQKTGR